MIPKVTIIGRRESDLDAFAKKLVEELQDRGLKVILAKRVDVENSLSPKPDTSTILYATDFKTTSVYKIVDDRFSLNELSKYVAEIMDVILLVDCPSWMLKDEHIAKLFIIEDEQEYLEHVKNLKGENFYVCSRTLPQVLGEDGNIINLQMGFNAIVEQIIKFVEDEKKIYTILDKLAGLNCGKCGYSSCLNLARAVKEGKASIEKCVPVSLKARLKCKIIVKGKEVYIQSFVSEIVRKSVLGMLSTLKGVEINGEETVEVRVYQ